MSFIIQRMDFKGIEPVSPADYYAGPVPAGDMYTSWTRQREDALRFAREKDAQTFADHGFFCNVQVVPYAKEAAQLVLAA